VAADVGTALSPETCARVTLRTARVASRQQCGRSRPELRQIL